MKELSLSLHKSFSPLLQIWHRKKRVLLLFLSFFQDYFRYLLGSSSTSLSELLYSWELHAGLLNVALYGFQLIVLLLRRPHFNNILAWVGYEGGLEPLKSVVDEKKLQM